jgi:hypothetical protein
MTSEGDSIGIRNDEAYMKSGFSLEKHKLEVSHDFRWSWWLCVVQHMFVYFSNYEPVTV